jgi:hypothetical protein
LRSAQNSYTRSSTTSRLIISPLPYKSPLKKRAKRKTAPLIRIKRDKLSNAKVARVARVIELARVARDIKNVRVVMDVKSVGGLADEESP